MTSKPQGRSGLANAQESIQELLDASAGSVKATTLTNLQQYETPAWLSTLCHLLLPTTPDTEFDPTCASGNLIRSARYGFGVDIDNKHATEDRTRLTGNMVKVWEILDDVYPDLRFECQVANPPFGLSWKVGVGDTTHNKADSTAYTYAKLRERTAWNGYGFMIANRKTIEKEDWQHDTGVYLYLTMPAGVWENCDVELGIVFWQNVTVPRELVTFNVNKEASLDLLKREPRTLMTIDEIAEVRRVNRLAPGPSIAPNVEALDGSKYASYACLYRVWSEIDAMLSEERRKIPPFNIYLNDDGMLQTYLSQRFQITRKILRDDVIKLERINKCHPLSLTAEKETRLLMQELLDLGVYTIQPEAAAAIKEALADVHRMSAPLMPVTQFMKVAYADESETLRCHNFSHGFNEDTHYSVDTGTYAWERKFSRKKIHWNKDDGQHCVDHSIQLSGMDRYISLKDEINTPHYFCEHPSANEMKNKVKSENAIIHHEAELWEIFDEPVVPTVVELNPEKIKINKRSLAMIEMMGGFKYYPGQVDYLARIGTKEGCIVAADVGCGKTLMAISLIQMKGPKRAMIIAPQGTMRGSDGVEQEYNASQWVTEISTFAPGLEVYEIFCLEDYGRIKAMNGGSLPNGVFISYYQAMFQNKGQESCPDTWNDMKLSEAVGIKHPSLIGEDHEVWATDEDGELKENDDGDHYKIENPKFVAVRSSKEMCKDVGTEKRGIRCILKPCLSTLIQHEFDAVFLDEAHLCSNLAANVTQMLIRMRPALRFALTATPIPNIVSNLFSVMGWVCVPDWYKDEIRNAAWPWARKEIGRFNNLFLSSERDYTQEALDELSKKKAGRCIKKSPVISSPARLLKHLSPSMAYIGKDMCNPKYVSPNIIDIRVGHGEEQAGLYSFFMDRGRIPGNAFVRAGKQIQYLRNICADPNGFKLKPDQLCLYDEHPPECESNMNPKTTAILELIRDIGLRDEQVVVVSSRIGQSNTIERYLRETGYRISRIDSTVPAKMHAQQASIFKARKTDVLIMGIKCAQGYSFPDCPNLIIGSLEYSYGPFHQAKGRVDRVNSRRQANIYCVLNKDSIEETMFDVVATKQDAATICLHGKRIERDFKPVDLGEVLAIALEKAILDTTSEALCESLWPEMRASFKRPLLA